MEEGKVARAQIVKPPLMSKPEITVGSQVEVIRDCGLPRGRRTKVMARYGDALWVSADCGGGNEHSVDDFRLVKNDLTAVLDWAAASGWRFDGGEWVLKEERLTTARLVEVYTRNKGKTWT